MRCYSHVSEKRICVSKCTFVIKNWHHGQVVQKRRVDDERDDAVVLQNLLRSFRYKANLNFSLFRRNYNQAALGHL